MSLDLWSVSVSPSTCLSFCPAWRSERATYATMHIACHTCLRMLNSDSSAKPAIPSLQLENITAQTWTGNSYQVVNLFWCYCLGILCFCKIWDICVTSWAAAEGFQRERKYSPWGDHGYRAGNEYPSWHTSSFLQEWASHANRLIDTSCLSAGQMHNYLWAIKASAP